MTLLPAWGQVVKPTAGALTPMNAAPAAVPVATPASGSVAKTGTSREIFKRLESDFDYQLKSADPNSPIDVLGLTRGLYLQGFGAVFTTEVDLAPSRFNPMFNQGRITAEQRVSDHDHKLRNLVLLRQQMGGMMATIAKNLELLGTNDQVVLAVRLWYQPWEDKTGLPDQIVMKADRRGAQSGDIKVDVQ
jgi:hypothetical protein